MSENPKGATMEETGTARHAVGTEERSLRLAVEMDYAPLDALAADVERLGELLSEANGVIERICALDVTIPIRLSPR